MNGRVYDPSLGRFVSADPFVQFPHNGQNLNRYSYVLNNPLSVIDQNGFCFSFDDITDAFSDVVEGAANAVWDNRRIIIAAVATYVTYGAASGWAFVSTWASGFAAANAGGTSGLLALHYTAAITGSVVGGATAGFVGTAILTDGDLDAAWQGAVGGALFGGIGGYYGNTWNWGRVGANSLAGGVSSDVAGCKFADGMKVALVVSVATYANYEMRQAMIRQSSRNPDNINGESRGFFGDGTKLAGSRRVVIDPKTGQYLRCNSPFGGCQGVPLPDSYDVRSSFFGAPYKPGSFPDYVNEAFAGPHDWFRNVTGAYDAMGNAHYLTGARMVVDTVLNGALIPVAAPFAGSAMVQPYMYDLLCRELE